MICLLNPLPPFANDLRTLVYVVVGVVRMSVAMGAHLQLSSLREARPRMERRTMAVIFGVVAVVGKNLGRLLLLWLLLRVVLYASWVVSFISADLHTCSQLFSFFSHGLESTMSWFYADSIWRMWEPAWTIGYPPVVGRGMVEYCGH